MSGEFESSIAELAKQANSLAGGYQLAEYKQHDETVEQYPFKMKFLRLSFTVSGEAASQ